MAAVNDIIAEVEQKARRAKEASRILARSATKEKNAALLMIAEELHKRQDEILAANAHDMKNGREKGLSDAMLDRLALNSKRIEDMALGLKQVASYIDPVGEIISGWKRPSGIEVKKVRVPLGVIALIYESRPNVTIEAAGLCLNAGNALVLRGGSEAIHSNVCLAKLAGAAIQSTGLPEGCIEIIESTDRAAAQHLMGLREYIDVLMPRGGGGLIRSVVENARVPVIQTGEGNCHLYVDASADLDMAVNIAVNAKCQRPSVCNAIETLLVHQSVADDFLPKVSAALTKAGVELRGDERTCQVVPTAQKASEEDWETEFLALILAVRVVSNINEAILHINRYSTGHSEAIITKDLEAARRFTEEIDSCAVFVNASTRFCDGGEFGLGAEIGISTQKLHARGPMGLEELTSYKYIVSGQGHVRG